MARSRSSRSRGGGRGGIAEYPVGRPLQASLVALERRIGLFSAEPGFSSEGRFAYPVTLEATGKVPAGMASLFAAELDGLRRLGKPADACHAAELAPYRVYCLPYFHYDGFHALLYVERDGRFVAGWREEEVLQPHTPRTFYAVDDRKQVDALLERLAGA